MLADAKQGLFDTIVCWKSDRLKYGRPAIPSSWAAGGLIVAALRPFTQRRLLLNWYRNGHYYTDFTWSFLSSNREKQLRYSWAVDLDATGVD